MNARWARFTRGWITAALATFVAAVFHVAAGGPSPSPLAVVLTMAFAVMLCVALAGRRVALWRQAVSVVASQFLFHALFVLGQGSAELAAGSATGHLHAGMTLSFAAGSPGAAELAHAGHVMWLGHALAAIVTVAALRYGDAALRGLAGLAGLRRGHLLRLTANTVPAECLPAAFPDVAVDLRRRIQHTPLSHRGPPAA